MTNFSESRRWQLAVDADVQIDDSVEAQINEHNEGSRIVFISDQIGYVFYANSSTDNCVYKKTTDGGASWSAGETNVGTTTFNCDVISVWYDQWTPGDVSGTIIHSISLAPAVNSLYYAGLDTSDDSQITEVAIDSSTSLTRIDSVNITKSTDSVLYVAVTDTDGGGSGVVYCAPGDSHCGSGGNSWSATNGTNPLSSDLGVRDSNRLLPMSNGNVMLIRNDVSTEDYEYRYYDGSDWDQPAAGWTDIDSNAPDDPATFEKTWSVSLRRYNNNLYIAYVSSPGTVDTAEVRAQVFDGSSWTALEDPISDADLGASETVFDTDIAVDEESGDLYVLYGRGTLGTPNDIDIYYKTLSYGSNSWSSQSTAQNTTYTAHDNQDIYLNVVDSERIYFLYYESASDDYYGGTIADLTPPVLDEVMRHGDWWSRVGKRKTFAW